MVKRWLIWLSLPFISIVILITNFSRSASLLQDTDTAVLLATIRSKGNPLSWFFGDWPLGNHFYRPISTLSFELDNWLYRENAAGYGFTNALIAAICILSLFWLLRELTELPWFAGISTLIFALWHFSSLSLAFVSFLCWVLAGLALLGVFRKNAKAAILASASLVFLGSLLRPNEDFSWRIVSWLPGRTASICALFSLVSLASYARFLRITTVTVAEEPTSTDLPATRGTQVTKATKHPKIWLAVSLTSCVLALGSYEQAVMLPALITVIYCFFRWSSRRSTALPVVFTWLLLVLYLVLRYAVIPHDMSGYQKQQTRMGYGVVLSLADYALPAWNWIRTLSIALPGAWILLLSAQPMQYLALILGNFSAWVQTKNSHQGLLVTSLYFLALVAFLPMAWLMPFGHYHYLPSAFLAAYCCGLGAIAGKAFLTAISPPTLQAPARQRPAPGSLHHP